MLKLTIDQKYLRKFFISRLKILLIRFYQQNSVDLEKDIQYNMHFSIC